MGHLINPISFRLGYSRNWGFSGALMESKSQYFYLNSNYWNLLLLFKRIFSLQIFEKMGIMFSHLHFIDSQNKSCVIIYLYDGPLQNESFIFYKYLNKYKKLKKTLKFGKRFFKKFFNRAFFSFYYLKTLFLIIDNFVDFLLNYINALFFQILQNIAFLKANINSLDNFYSAFLKTLSINKQVFVNFFMNYLFKKKINNFLFACLNLDYCIKEIFYKNYSCSLNFSYFIDLFFDSLKKIKKCLFFFNCYNLKLFVKIYNKLFFNINILDMVKYLNNRYNVYYKNVSLTYSNEILNINQLKLKRKIFTNINFLIIIFVNSLFETTFLQRLFFYKFFDKLVFSFGKKRKKKFIFLGFFFKFFIFLSNNFFIFLKNIIFTFKPFINNLISKKFSIYFKNISKSQITASLIAQYICIRLKQRFSLKEILKPILKDLTRNSGINGFRLSCCGRFTKKEIATYKWERRGKISLNTIDAHIDYSYNYVILKYSVCGIKIWLHRNKNYKYFLKKWFENFRHFYEKKKRKRKIRYYKNRNNKKISKKHRNIKKKKKLKLKISSSSSIYKKMISLILKNSISFSKFKNDYIRNKK